MASPQEYTMVADTARRVSRSVLTTERQPRNRPRKRGRWPVGDGGGGCDPQNAILQVTVLGSPAGGTFDLILTVGGPETITLNYDDTAAAVKTALESHSEIAAGDVKVTGGPFPDATMQIEFQGDLANTPIAVPLAAWNGFSGGAGVGVITSIVQVGVADE